MNSRKQMGGYYEIKDEKEYNDFLEQNEYLFVIYSAKWCKPCKSFKEWLAKEYTEYAIPILVIDVDNLEELAIGISGLPTMVGLHNKEEFIRTEGFNQQKLETIFQETLELAITEKVADVQETLELGIHDKVDDEQTF